MKQYLAWLEWSSLPQGVLHPLALILFLGFWFAHPYQLTYVAYSHADEDSAALAAAQGTGTREVALPLLAGLSLALGVGTGRRNKTTLLRLIGSTYTLWAYCSVIWSEDKALTLKRLIVFSLLLIIASVLSMRVTLAQFAQIAYICCGLAFVAGVLCELYYGTIQLGDADYRFAGVMHANAQGMNLVVFTLSGLAILPAVSKACKTLIVTSIFLAFPFLVLTKSRTATATCLVVAAYYLFRCYRPTLPQVLITSAVMIGAAGIVLSSPAFSDSLKNGLLLGRQHEDSVDSLSNRLPLWEECGEYLSRNPILGYGYGAFWTPERIQKISHDQGWSVPSAHNGFLDASLELGLVGVLLYASLFFGALSYWHSLYQSTGEALCLYASCLLAWLILSLSAESLRFDGCFWPTFTVYVLVVKAALGLPHKQVIPTQQRKHTVSLKTSPLEVSE